MFAMSTIVNIYSVCWLLAKLSLREAFGCFAETGAGVAWVFAMNRAGDLVGGLEHFLFFHILGMSSSQLTDIFQRG